MSTDNGEGLSTSNSTKESSSGGRHAGGDSISERQFNLVIAKFGRVLVTAAEKGLVGALILRFFRGVTSSLTITYIGFCIILWIAMGLVGEKNITSAFLLYIPPMTWLLPFLVLLPLALIFHRGCFLAQIATVTLLLWGWLGYGLEHTHGGGSNRLDNVLTIMTYNRGQHMNQSLQPFKNATNPDIIAFQEASGRADGFLRSPDYAEFEHGVSVGEFTLISRYPITESSLLGAPDSPTNGGVARFVIDWNGHPVSIFVVHLRTPREVLNSYRRGAFLWGVLGMPGTPWAEKRRQYQTFWDGQIGDVERILNAVRTESNPCIVVGDFNAPSTGWIYRSITKELGDAHSASGSGFGFTFPGVTHNPLSLGGPWMRIDYVF
ncbi:endonuclease/exonuclease/phosphatase family protein, partial [Prosthecobacter sp.]|uniref:endonuclease/exonuclease/phosphatase family protein n=1 Tax=Prosthecobacter sp. TaxID=1965333 RepID=UPI0037C6784E